MGKKDKKEPRIHIELDNPYRSYFAGQILDGRVIIGSKKEKKIKGVTILLEGRGRVHWTEKEAAYHTVNSDGKRTTTAHQPVNRTRIVELSAEESYLSHRMTLAGDGNKLIILPEGLSIYPFRFALPSNLPSSFTSKIGLVSYFLEAEVKQPLLKKDKKTCLPFTVNGIFDLNREAGATLPQECKMVKGSNFMACRKGKLGFVLNLHQRSGFVPGEVLDFRVEITNGTNRKVNGVKTSLLQVTAFYAQGRTKQVQKIVAELKGPEIDQGEHEMWAPTTLHIPSLPPTGLGGTSRLIDVRYFLCFEMKIAGLSNSLTGRLPVMIGTIPLRATFVEFRPAPHIPVMPTPQPQSYPAPNYPASPPVTQPGPSTSTHGHLPEKSYNAPRIVDSTPSAPIFPDYPDLPPPSYSEAVEAEGFTWNPTGSLLQGQDDSGSVEKNIPDDFLSASPPSAPPIEEYVPNYITYNRKS